MLDNDDVESPTENPDIMPENNWGTGELHPSPEMLLIRMAIDKALFKDQRELWFMYAYDKLSPADIARKLHKDKSTISRRLKVIEGKIAAYCHEHWQVHKALKEGEAYESEDSGC